MIKERREELGFSLKTVSEASGVSSATIHKMETEGRIPVNPHDLHRVSEALKLDPVKLLYSLYMKRGGNV